jgi:nicotinate-nucleotide pyrophosphorylase (carboxylating)
VSPRVDETFALREQFEQVVRTALREDLGDEDLKADVTTTAIVPASQWGRATITAKQAGVLAGLDAVRAVYAQLDDRVVVKPLRADGDDVEAGTPVATIEGPVRPILVGERTALNLTSHLSGIATTVRAYARKAGDVVVTDTRKTLPGLRLLQKYAVRTGGGTNHRFALWDGVLVKDTHIVAAGGVGEAVRRVRAQTALPVQAECQSLREVDDALDAGAHAILLDNQSPASLRDLTAHIKTRADYVLVEASGGVTIENVAEVASTGVDRISIGAFTHSVTGLDLSLRLETVWEEKD